MGPMVAVGHSMGSVISIALATRFADDLDGVVLTGFVHNRNPDANSQMEAGAHEATLDPLFAEASWAETYWTSKPGARTDLFYVVENADPEAIATDEATKATLTISEIMSMLPYYGPISLSIQVPVLILIGDNDLLGCGGELDCHDQKTVKAHEQKFFSPSACLETKVIEQTGHNLNLHLNAPQNYALIHSWMARRIGVQPESSPSAPCEP
jgi:pimeloyl-ACP methyl ester carboxylesterase